MDLDILILDEIGKNISRRGDGYEGGQSRGQRASTIPGTRLRKFQRIFVRDLSELTYNSAVGLGMADVVTDRLVKRINWEPTLDQFADRQHAGGDPHADPFPTDRECLERIAPTVGKLDLDEVTYGWIRNTMELGAAGAEREPARRSGEEPDAGDRGHDRVGVR